MSETNNQWIDAIAKLTELTQNGKLEWGVDEFFEAPGAASPAYTAVFNNRTMRLQKRRVTEESLFGKRQVRDAFTLEFVGPQGNSLWQFPEIDAIEDLFAAVQYQTAGVREFLNDILSKAG